MYTTVGLYGIHDYITVYDVDYYTRIYEYTTVYGSVLRFTSILQYMIVYSTVLYFIV